jgi:DNA-binding GntR family transcriptional regulator
VHEHTIPEIRDIYEVRLALEGLAARLAAERASGELLMNLQRTLPAENWPSPGTGPAPEQLTGVQNAEFHDAIVEAAQNPRLLQMVRQSREYAFNERLAKLYTPAELRAASESHRQLVSALLARNGELAETVARAHVRESFAIIESRLG